MPPPDSPAPRGRSVLLVEDQDIVRRVTARLLRSEGFEVLEASDGPRALEAAASHGKPIDLLFTDMGLEGINGHQLAVELLQRQPDLRVLFASGFTAESLDQDLAIATKSDFMSKPYTIEELRERIAQLFA